MAKHYANPARSGLLTAAQNGIFNFVLPVSGTLKEVRFYSSVAAATAAAVFDVNKGSAGATPTTIFSDPVNRPAIAVGATTGARTNLAVSVLQGDRITVDLDSVHTSGIGNPLSCVIVIDDGDATLSIEQFIADFYTGAFNRPPTDTELNANRSTLQTACAQGGLSFRDAVFALAETLFTSAEYTARARTDAQFVGDLYLAYLGRVGDADGAAYWTTQTGAQGRAAVRASFAGSTEFIDIRAAKTCPNSLRQGAVARGDVNYTTASLADLASENGNVNLGKSFALLRVTADRACRVRLYSTVAARTADASRAIGTDPVGEHGVIADLVFVTGNLTLDLAPQVFGANLESTVAGTIAAAIQNRSGSAHTVALTFSRLLIES